MHIHVHCTYVLAPCVKLIHKLHTVHLAVQGMHLSEDGYVDKFVFIGEDHSGLAHKDQSMVGVKKVPIYCLYNGTGNTVPFPFRFRLISVRLPF